ncbi:hypothetical protein, partial [Laspinema palackyanum]|uniref:hypothetical protein n=1 Tax=Laspinema palackyanum TaxID=3231601 RepID=UPI00345D837A|nr:hypothetical protein [Laspinema sp. D2c]
FCFFVIKIQFNCHLFYFFKNERTVSHYTTQTALLGEVEIRFGEIPGERNTPISEQLRTPQPGLYNFPATGRSGRSPYYAARVEEQGYLCGSNTSISPLEFEQILQSLVLLE